VSFIAAEQLPSNVNLLVKAMAGAGLVAIVVSLLVSLYVYDLSGFYSLHWLDDLGPVREGKVLNVSAGFDETSALLRDRYPGASLTPLDFYDPQQHTEVSIKRARKAYPPSPEIIRTHTATLALPDSTSDLTFVIFAAHEIRDEAERTQFFRELNRTLRPEGKIVIVEHVRNVANLLAYTAGAFHFFPRSSWLRTFTAAKLEVSLERRITPFVTLFVLEKHGATSHDHRNSVIGARGRARDLSTVLRVGPRA
jgi:SAM-dependent methyltransferase